MKAPKKSAAKKPSATPKKAMKAMKAVKSIYVKDSEADSASDFGDANSSVGPQPHHTGGRAEFLWFCLPSERRRMRARTRKAIRLWENGAGGCVPREVALLELLWTCKVEMQLPDEVHTS